MIDEKQVVAKTIVPTAELRASAQRLYRHIHQTHWNGGLLVGPDPGIRFNSRFYRFPKSYLRFVPWGDQLIYAQAQKYWIHSNWLANDLRLMEGYDFPGVATACAEALRKRQRPEGYWEYPNPEWRGRIATVEGNYGAIGMLLTYQRTRSDSLLQGAAKWHDYAVDHIGFQQYGNTIAINYFGNVAGGRVPNNAASAVRTFALLANEANDERFLKRCPALMDFMTEAQLDSGELPYAVKGVTARDRIHFLCYQYNAFQFLNIWDYFELTKDEKAWPVLERLAGYVSEAITPSGSSRYMCGQDYPDVVYYGGAAAAALSQATAAGLGNYRELADRAFRRLLSVQQADGSFPYSFRNYRVLSDRRSYPRYLSMILTHLLLELQRHETGSVAAQG